MTTRIGSHDFLRFNEQLWGLVRARVPLDEGLRRVAEELNANGSAQSRLRSFTDAVAEDLSRGLQLSEALRARGGLPDYYIALIRAGEAGGSLGDVLHHIVSETRRQLRHRHAVVSSMAYPIMVTLLAIGLISGIGVFLVPQFIDIYHQLGADLPLPTAFLVSFFAFVRENAYVIGTVLAGVVAAVVLLCAGAIVPGFRDALVLNLPVIGPIMYSHTIVGFARSLGYLLARGVAMVDALTLTASVLANRVARRFVTEAREGVERGQTLSEALEGTTLLAPSMQWMIRLAEDRGDLGATLMDIADYYQARVEQSRRTVETLVEPLLIAVIGITIGAIIIVLYLPLFYIPRAIR